MNKNFEVPCIFKSEWLNKRTLDNGETVNVDHGGEIVITEDNIVVCGDENVAFISFKDDIYKIICTDASLDSIDDQIITRTFTIDNDKELYMFNAVQSFVNTHGKEYHEIYFTDFEKTPVVKNKYSTEEIMRASDKDLGLNFADVIGKAYGVDYDEEAREERRLDLAIANAERAGKVDPKNIDNKENICFSIDVSDQVENKKYTLQRLERGFDDTETWNMDNTVSRFIAPRLRRFIEDNIAYPSELTSEEWDKMLKVMLWSFEHNNYDDFVYDKTTGEPVREGGNVDDNLFECYFWDLSEEFQDKIRERYNKGIELFGKWFQALWW